MYTKTSQNEEQRDDIIAELDTIRKRMQNEQRDFNIKLEMLQFN